LEASSVSEVESPCIKLCEVDANGICRGCLRTLAEIGAWRDASDIERRAILAAVAARRAALGTQATRTEDER